MAQDEIRRVSRKVVRELRNRRGYGFLEEEGFVSEVYACACQDDKCCRLAKAGSDLTGPINRITKNVYSKALYEGCRSDKVEEQNRAYEELSQYLYLIAYNFVKMRVKPLDLAQDYTQEALERIWRNINQCREPGAFLKWTKVILIRIANRGLEREREDLPLPEDY